MIHDGWIKKMRNYFRSVQVIADNLGCPRYKGNSVVNIILKGNVVVYRCVCV